MRKKTLLTLVGIIGISGAVLAGCANGQSASSKKSSSDKIIAVGAENEYADVISQIGGKYTSVTGIMSNPEADPHSYEANTKDASQISKADLIVQNGLGYDDFMSKLENGSKNSNRKVIDVAKALNYSADTENPHLWYKPETMKRVARLITTDLEKVKPSKKDYFENNLTKFNDSLKTWENDIQTLKNDYPQAKVAVTEPVSDYLVDAANLKNMTPWNYQAAVMNGTDPSPQDIKTQKELFNNKTIKVFLYNQQAIDDSTTELLSLAKKNNIPVVGVYETAPSGYTYQKWMEKETEAIISAIKEGKSTEKL